MLTHDAHKSKLVIRFPVLFVAEVAVCFLETAAVTKLETADKAVVFVFAAGPIVVSAAGGTVLQDWVVSFPVLGWRPLSFSGFLFLVVLLPLCVVF